MPIALPGTDRDNRVMMALRNSIASEKEGIYLINNTMTAKTPIMPTVPISRLVLVNILSINPAFPCTSLTNESIGSYIMKLLSFKKYA
jgi:hypothetical protein